MWKAVVGILLGLIIAEGAFYVRDQGAFPHLNIYRADPEFGVALRADDTTALRVADNPATDVRTNSLGFRGPEWPKPQASETLVLGDSQVFGLGVSEGETFSAELARLLGEPVRNAGVPTYGPDEYTALLARLLPERKPKRVVYVLNLANDLFELGRPNRERHAVWDGWAVRIETAPAAPSAFPGRAWLMGRSHLVFALRSLFHSRAADDTGFASEGSWLDIANAARAAGANPPKQSDVSAALGARQAAGQRWQGLHDRVVYMFSVLVRANDRYAAEAKRLTGYAGDARDIVENPFAESNRAVNVTAYQLMQAALSLESNAADLRALAATQHNDALIALLDERSAARAELLASSADSCGGTCDFEHPALGAVLARTAALCEAARAELFVVALPLDVQVSQTEWEKYGLPARDLGPSEALLDLITRSAAAVFARPVSALSALRAAEPGAFLKGDLHMTAKGHAALARLLAQRIREAPGDSGLLLPRGRTFPPTPAEWNALATALAFEADGSACSARTLREWLRLECRGRETLAPPLGRAPQITLRQGGHGDALLWSGPLDSAAIAPVLAGDTLRIGVRWPGEQREVAFSRDSAGKLTLVFGAATPVHVENDARGNPRFVPWRVTPESMAVELWRGFADVECVRTSTVEPEEGAAFQPREARCLLDDPKRRVACPQGSAPFGTTRRCAAPCAPDGSCPDGRHCEAFAGRFGCVAP